MGWFKKVRLTIPPHTVTRLDGRLCVAPHPSSAPSSRLHPRTAHWAILCFLFSKAGLTPCLGHGLPGRTLPGMNTYKRLTVLLQMGIQEKKETLEPHGQVQLSAPPHQTALIPRALGALFSFFPSCPFCFAFFPFFFFSLLSSLS